MVDSYGYWPDGPPDGADPSLPNAKAAVPTSPIGTKKTEVAEKLTG